MGIAVAHRRDLSGAPGLSPRHVPRPRLVALLDAAPGDAIVLAAPAGYGKTTLAAEWARGRTTTWFDASFAGGDLAAFTGALVTAARRVLPALRSPVPEPNAPPEEAAHDVAAGLAEGLADWPADAWLVVDDYLLPDGSSAVDTFVDRLLALSPLRLLVTARTRPSWATARRVLYGDVTLVGRDELAMTADEAAELVGHAVPEAVRELVEHAEGWPALVGLAALAAGRLRPEHQIADALYRYFAEEVLRAASPVTRRFMLLAAVPLTVEPEQAAAHEEIVEHLVSEGVLQTLPDGRFRFHPLLREFLVRKLREEQPDEWRRARADAVAGARAARPEEAFALSVEAGDLDAAADVFADVADELLERGRLETVERWLAACGSAATRRPALQVARAEVLIRRGRLVEASALAHELASSLPDAAPEASAAWYLAGRAFHLLSKNEQALDCHLRASRTARTSRDRTNALWGASVVAAQLASPVVDDVVAEMEEVAAHDLDASLQLVSAKVFLGTRRNTLAGVWRSIEHLADVEHTSADGMARHTFLLAAGYLNSANARYARAHALVERALALGRELELGRAKAAFALGYAAAAAIGLRRFGDAERRLNEVAALGVERMQVVLAEQSILRAKLVVAQGRGDALPEVGDALADAAPATAVGEYAGLLAIARAAAGDDEAALAHAATAAAGGTIEGAFYARAAETLCARDDESAKELFDAAFDAEFLDVVVLAYRADPSLLARLAETVPRAVLTDLLARSNDEALARRAGLARLRPSREGGGASLTPREREVLELIAQGLSNADVARRLFISQKTAKVHVSHIFEKLSVQSRVQAVLAWHDLQG